MDRYRFQILDGTSLKLLALAFMTVDHVGMIIFPRVIVLRLIGRLAFPLFAFMIAEGCYYTRNKKKYFGLILAVGILCQVIAYVSQRTLYMCTLITFAMSLVIIFALQRAIPDRNRQKGTDPGKISGPWCLITAGLIVLSAFITIWLPKLLPGTDFKVDYGFFGVLLPVVVYLPNLFLTDKGVLCRLIQTALLAVWVFPLWLTSNKYEWFAVFSAVFLLLYNGRRGRLRLKYLFYIYYPVHLGVIYMIGTVISK
ncbi:MAG: hypothetical protein E7233_07710 [Lachnospiraceae bacterium]|nr:hypothetical protein [Lachnospiraceae bacterium]